MDFKMSGFEELQKSLKAAMKLYPDLAEERLEKTAEDFRERVIETINGTVEEYAEEAIAGCELGAIEINGTTIEKDFRGTSPELYRIENGYEKVVNDDTSEDGQSITWVPGRFIVKQVSNEWNNKIPKVMQELLDDMSKEVGLK